MIDKTEYKTTNIGLIPAQWQVLKLEEVAKVERGRFSPRPRNNPIYYGGAIPFVQTSDVTLCGGRIRSYSQTLNEKGLAVSKLFPKGSVLITIAANIGYSGILELGMACPDSLIGISCKKDLNNEYLNYYLHSQQRRLDYLATPGAQKNINVSFLKKYPIIIPPIPEQQKIAAILSTWDKSIGLIENLIEVKEEMKRGVVQRLLTAKLRVKGFNDKWKERKFEEVFSFVSTYAFSREDLSYDDKYLVYNIHYGDIHSSFEGNFIDFEKNEIPKIIQSVNVKSPEHYLQDGDLIMADVSEDYEGVGECMEVTNINGKKAIGGLHTFVIRDRKGYTIPTFRTYLFNETVVRNKLRRIATGSSVYGISKKSLSQIHLLLPSIDEQLEISKILMNVDKEIELLKNKLEALKEQKEGLMQHLLTGKIRV